VALGKGAGFQAQDRNRGHKTSGRQDKTTGHYVRRSQGRPWETVLARWHYSRIVSHVHGIFTQSLVALTRVLVVPATV